MATFFSELWDSVFQGGTNKSLRLATYGSCAALQVTLFAMLVVTRSWHFVFLSVICACLWGSIVWFINELEDVKRLESEAEEVRKLKEENEKQKDS